MTTNMTVSHVSPFMDILSIKQPCLKILSRILSAYCMRMRWAHLLLEGCAASWAIKKALI